MRPLWVWENAKWQRTSDEAPRAVSVRRRMTPDERWLRAQWPFVRGQLPAAPGTVVEIGCGPLGGFVPALQSAGYDAIGVDPEAPEEASYRRIEFELYEAAKPVNAVVACTSLHHVVDLDLVLNRAAASLVPGGTLVVIEWAWERFDEATARWCFARLPPVTPGAEPGWLDRHQHEWTASRLSWQEYCRSWAAAEGLHAGENILRKLAGVFDPLWCTYGPYFFCDLARTTEEDEQAAIDVGRIQATGIRYAGRVR
jgi:SAM-dependent methyltransferase